MPAHAVYNKSCVEVLASVLASSSGNAARIQLPMRYSSIAPTTALKNRRTIEDHLVKQKLTAETTVALLFERPQSEGNDRRSLMQSCIVSFYGAFNDCAFSGVKPVVEGRVGPFGLAKVSEMLGIDESSKPSPGNRLEQILIYVLIPRVFVVLLLAFINIVAKCNMLCEEFRKGFDLRESIIDADLDGLDVVFFDIVPNRSPGLILHLLEFELLLISSVWPCVETVCWDRVGIEDSAVSFSCDSNSQLIT